MPLHLLVLIVNYGEERALGISFEAFAMDCLVELKLCFAGEGDLKAARLAESLTLNL
jgi:hypothetical protein